MEGTAITGKHLIDDFTLLVLKTVRDIELKLTASQLSQIVTGAETMIRSHIGKNSGAEKIAATASMSSEAV